MSHMMTGIIVYVSRTTFGNPTHINISENNPNIQKFLHTHTKQTILTFMKCLQSGISILIFHV